jgi:hypothetical protein
MKRGAWFQSCGRRVRAAPERDDRDGPTALAEGPGPVEEAAAAAADPDEDPVGEAAAAAADPDQGAEPIRGMPDPEEDARSMDTEEDACMDFCLRQLDAEAGFGSEDSEDEPRSPALAEHEVEDAEELGPVPEEARAAHLTEVDEILANCCWDICSVLAADDEGEDPLAYGGIEVLFRSAAIYLLRHIGESPTEAAPLAADAMRIRCQSTREHEEIVRGALEIATPGP